MGTIIKAICKCGFESDDIFAGGSMFNFKTNCSAPAICPNCSKFQKGNYLNKESNCFVCKTKLTFYNNPILQ